MKRIFAIFCVVGMSLTALSAFAAEDKATLDARVESAKDVLDAIMATPDKGIPQGILAGAACVVVVPHYKKGAFVVGAQYGQGVATCRTGHGWSAPVFVKLEGGSFGWQIGGQSTDLILVAMNRDGLQQQRLRKLERFMGETTKSARQKYHGKKKYGTS